MPLTNEALIAIIGLLVSCPPTVLLLWHLFKRAQSTSGDPDTLMFRGKLLKAS